MIRLWFNSFFRQYNGMDRNVHNWTRQKIMAQWS